MGKLLEFKNVTKTFPGVKALDDVSRDLNQGEVHVIVGENGAGKSTLMKVLLGVYAPDGESCS
jgi:ABC-type sugar transport system ATPase subunit